MGRRRWTGTTAQVNLVGTKSTPIQSLRRPTTTPARPQTLPPPPWLPTSGEITSIGSGEITRHCERGEITRHCERGEATSSSEGTIVTTNTHGRHRPSNEDEEFKWRFNYSNPNCHVLSHFNCALSGKILLQGKMWITTTAIGFHSVFNDSTFLSLIPTILLFEIKDIINMSKKANALIFNNSIEFTLKDGDKFFFTSYVRRDKAWALLMLLTNFQYDDPANSKSYKSLISKRNYALVKSLRPSTASTTTSEDETDEEVDNASEDLGYLTNTDECMKILPATAHETYPKSDYPNEICLGQFDCSLSEAYKLLYVDGLYFNKCRELEGSRNIVRGVPSNPISPNFDEACEDVVIEATWEKKMINKNAFMRLPDWLPVTEIQTLMIQPSKQQFILQSAISWTKTPFCDSFFLSNRLIVTSISITRCQIDIQLDVMWTKVCLIKSQIRSACVAEWRDSAMDLRRAITSILPRVPRLRRKRLKPRQSGTCCARVRPRATDTIVNLLPWAGRLAAILLIVTIITTWFTLRQRSIITAAIKRLDSFEENLLATTIQRLDNFEEQLGILVALNRLY